MFIFIRRPTPRYTYRWLYGETTHLSCEIYLVPTLLKLFQIVTAKVSSRKLTRINCVELFKLIKNPVSFREG
jgi:hypothetical protein